MFNSGERFEQFRSTPQREGKMAERRGYTVHEPKEAKSGPKVGMLKPSQHFGTRHAGGKHMGRRSSRH